MKAIVKAEFLSSESKKSAKGIMSNVVLLQGKYNIYAVTFDEEVVKQLDLLDRMDNVVLLVNTYAGTWNEKGQLKVVIEKVRVDDDISVKELTS